MRILLSPQGCPWDRKQTHESLMKYMREETEEAAQAVANKDWDNLKEELGDCLLQIVFHAEMARLEGHFCLADVIKGINAKMVRRHPHIFGEKKAGSPEEVLKIWAEAKKQEKEKKK
ncbi:MAG: nucleotide pyrophosphohydrolase [Elusimicrobiales bacterium]|nr:nucleotide pyrophosphohydrolase [Elusimicrobiales bacterium]